MSKQDFKARVEALPGMTDVRPRWSSMVPLCNENCPSFDGKRCERMGCRPDRICEPAVKAVVELQAANARLVAAAPELLESLEVMLGDPEEICTADIERARAAVQKAKGFV